jgi:hypothetical protein
MRLTKPSGASGRTHGRSARNGCQTGSGSRLQLACRGITPNPWQVCGLHLPSGRSRVGHSSAQARRRSTTFSRQGVASRPLAFVAVAWTVGWLRAHARVGWPRHGPEAAVRSGLASEDSRDPTEQPGRVSPRFGGLHATLRANLGCSQALCFPRQWPHLLDRGSGTHQHWYGRAGGSLFRRRPASSSRRKGQRMGVPTATGASGLLLTLAAGPPRERSVVQRADGGARSS